MSENRQPNDALKSFAMPAYDQIPDVGLYLDQVARFINSFLGDFPEMQVTPSMISNYAKQKLIDRVNKKTYTRDQIAALILIVLSKTVISIDHVRLMLSELRSESGCLNEPYCAYRESLCEVLNSLSDNRGYQSASASDERDMMIKNIVTAIAHKMYLERWFENHSIEA